jgi:organic radical activating enzyme
MVYSNMKAPGDKRPTWRGGVIQVHVTRACDLSCVGCTQGSNLAGKPTVITLDNFEKAVKSLKDYYGVVGVFGGNPCLHPQFETLCEILEAHINWENRGLWSNNLRQHGKLCSKVFNPAVSNLNVHTKRDVYHRMKLDWPECNPIGLYDSRHSPPYVAMRDIEDLTDDDRWKLINNCDINQYWSAMLCQFRGELRAFFCEIAGAQSMLHENEDDYPDTGLVVTDDWWKLPIEAFDEQIRKHCFDCGIPLRGKGDLAVSGTREYVSKTHLNIYKLKGSSRELIQVSSTKELNGKVTRATDYINNGMAPTVWMPNY